MAKHRLGNQLIRLLSRLGWQLNPSMWTIHCRDLDGRKVRLRVQLNVSGIAISGVVPRTVVLAPLEVGRLRAALRDALLCADRLGSAEQLACSSERSLPDRSERWL